MRLVLLAGWATIGIAAPAWADVVAYQDAPSFAAATSGDTTYTITGPATDFNGAYTQGPVTFTSTTVNRFNDGEYGAGVAYLEFYPSQAFANVSTPGVSAIGFTLGTFAGANTINISVNAVPTTAVTTAAGPPSTVFLGFTDTDPITSITFFDTAASSEIDVLNFTTGTLGQGGTVQLPEPASLALLGAGTLALGIQRRRKPA